MRSDKVIKGSRFPDGKSPIGDFLRTADLLGAHLSDRKSGSGAGRCFPSKSIMPNNAFNASVTKNRPGRSLTRLIGSYSGRRTHLNQGVPGTKPLSRRHNDLNPFQPLKSPLSAIPAVGPEKKSRKTNLNVAGSALASTEEAPNHGKPRHSAPTLAFSQSNEPKRRTSPGFPDTFKSDQIPEKVLKAFGRAEPYQRLLARPFRAYPDRKASPLFNRADQRVLGDDGPVPRISPKLILLAMALFSLGGCCASPHWKNCSYRICNDSERMAFVIYRSNMETPAWLNLVGKGANDDLRRLPQERNANDD
jgi:hypothetical protein